MKWEIVNNSPKLGEIRFKTKFAWLPTRVISKLTDTDHMIWFELYIEEQEYTRTIDKWDGAYNYYWCTVAKTIHI
jgi:hypothetical protein